MTIEHIIKTVCEYYNLTPDIFHSKTRKREIVQARQIAMFFSKSLTKCSLVSIGFQIGKKDHATVLHACKNANNLIDTDKQFKTDINEIEKRLISPLITREEINEAIRNAIIKRFASVLEWRKIYKSLL